MLHVDVVVPFFPLKTQVLRWTRKSCSPILGSLNMFEAQKVADFKA